MFPWIDKRFNDGVGPCVCCMAMWRLRCQKKLCLRAQGTKGGGWQGGICVFWHQYGAIAQTFSFNLRGFINIWDLNITVRAIYASMFRSKVFGHSTGRLENVQSYFITFRCLSGNANGASVTIQEDFYTCGDLNKFKLWACANNYWRDWTTPHLIKSAHSSGFIIHFIILVHLTCCAGEAAVRNVASFADILNCGGTSQLAYPVGSWPAGWKDGTGATEAAGGPLGRSPALSRNYSDNGSNRCDHKGCPWVWWGAADRCGTQVHHPHLPGIRTDGFQGLRAAGHTPYRHVPTTAPQRCCQLWSLLQPLADRVHFKLLCLNKDLSVSVCILVYFMSASKSWSCLLFHHSSVEEQKQWDVRWDYSFADCPAPQEMANPQVAAKWQQATAASSQRVSWGTKGILLSARSHRTPHKCG